MKFDAFGWFDLPFILTTFSYFGISLWAVYSRRRNAMQYLYGLLCFVTAVWQGLWVVLVGQASGPYLDIVVKTAYAVVLFIPPIFYHFLSAFTGRLNERRWLYGVYGFSALFASAALTTDLFVHGFYSYAWGHSARAGVIHPLFSVLVAVVIFRIWVLLKPLSAQAGEPDLQIKQRKLVRVASFVYCGGAIDLISNYGLGVFPLSFLFTGVALVLIGIAILRYEFLAPADIEQTVEDLARQDAAHAEMANLGMAAAFPLVSQGEVLGYLLLGEKMSEESYSKEDILLLRIVANQAALAYQRVRYLEMAVHGARTEMLGEIAGGFAHEIKTPLANISLPAELSLMDLSDVEQGTRKMEEVLPELKIRLRDIMHQTMKASEKIEAVRQFSKPGQVKLEPVDLSQVLQNSLGLLDHLLRKTGIKVRADFPPIMSRIRGDAKQLEIVFVNLIKNAAEAMSQHATSALSRELLLKGQEDANWIIASVKDTGPGIKRTEMGHLFEAYFTTKGSVGTGMGLFLSRQVIKAHGGSIDVKSEEGKGTEFIVRLPKQLGQENTPSKFNKAA